MASSLFSTPTPSSLHHTSISSLRAASISKHGGFISQRGSAHFQQWNGLNKHVCVASISQYSIQIERKRKCKGKGVYASLFGVGAPEALVIGVVALLVFGPKGLAEAARNIGQALRGIQPTIRELQEVSREFKTSLEREIGLDETDYSKPRSSSSPVVKDTPLDYNSQENLTDKPASDEVQAYSADDYLKFTEAQLKAAQSKLEASSQDTTSQNPEDDSPRESTSAQALDPKPEAEA